MALALFMAGALCSLAASTGHHRMLSVVGMAAMGFGFLLMIGGE
jgi:hypothetical protein